MMSGATGDGNGTAATIVSRNIPNSKTENRLSLATNGEYARTPYFGGEWHKIRIVLMFRATGAATFNPNFRFGLCNTNSLATSVGSATCTNFIGFSLDSGTYTWTHNAGVVRNWYSQGIGTNMADKRVNTITTHGGGVGSDGRHWGSQEDSRTVWVVEITRPVFATSATSVTYSFTWRSTSTNNAEFSVSKDALIRLLEGDVGNQDIVNITGTDAGAVTGSFSFDESTGAFDTLNIFWGSTPNLELSAIGVRKIY